MATWSGTEFTVTWSLKKKKNGYQRWQMDCRHHLPSRAQRQTAEQSNQRWRELHAVALRPCRKTEVPPSYNSLSFAGCTLNTKETFSHSYNRERTPSSQAPIAHPPSAKRKRQGNKSLYGIHMKQRTVRLRLLVVSFIGNARCATLMAVEPPGRLSACACRREWAS